MMLHFSDGFVVTTGVENERKTKEPQLKKKNAL